MANKRYSIVLNRSEETQFVLEKAAALASAKDAEVQVVRIIHDELVDFSRTSDSEAQRLKLSLMESEHQFLDDLLDDMQSRFKRIETLIVWDRRVSEGTLAAARDFSADMIIKAVDPGSRMRTRTPDDWNLLRETQVPVFMLHEAPWESGRVVLAAVDLLDDAHDVINRRVIQESGELASELNGKLHLVYAYPDISVRAAVDPELGIDEHTLARDVTSAVSEKLCRIAGEYKVEQLHVEKGTAAVAVNKAIGESSAEIVVLGNAARKGVAGTLFGNTAEALLSKVDADLLVLPT